MTSKVRLSQACSVATDGTTNAARPPGVVPGVELDAPSELIGFGRQRKDRTRTMSGVWTAGPTQWDATNLLTVASSRL